jgi:hypothetical protein
LFRTALAFNPSWDLALMMLSKPSPIPPHRRLGVQHINC